MVVIKKQGWVSRLGDVVMLPLMYLLQGTFCEVPQRTHRWNNSKFNVSAVAHFDSNQFISVAADGTATPRWFLGLPIFHMPIIGGWKKFIVLEPVVPQDVWYVGWIPGDTIGLSQVPLRTGVRLLQGPSHVYFFGLNEHGEQIVLRQAGAGLIKKAGAFAKLPLL